MATDVQALRAKTEEDLRSGNYVDAVRSARRLLLSQPRDANARMMLGRALYALERFNEARVEMISLMRVPDAPIDAFRLYIEIAFLSSDTHAARDGLHRLVARFPDDEDAQHRLHLLESGELSREVTIERWFDPLAAGTVEASSDEFPGAVTVVTSPGMDAELQASANPLATPELNLEQPAEEPVEVMSGSWVQQSSEDYHLGSEEFQEVLMSFSSEVESISVSAEVDTLGSSEFEFLASDAENEELTEQVADPHEVAQASEAVQAGYPEAQAGYPGAQAGYPEPRQSFPEHPEYSTPSLAEIAGYELDDQMDAAPTQIRSVSGELASQGYEPARQSGASVDLQPDRGVPPRSVVIRQNTTHRLMAITFKRVFGRIGERFNLRSRALFAGVALIALVLVGALWLLSGDSALSESIRLADADGRPASMRAALAFLENDLDETEETQRLRMLATQLLEQAEGDAAELQAVLESLSEEQRQTPDAVLGHTYMSLALGDADRAQELLSVVQTREDLASELARARSRTALANGELESALTYAQQAVSQAPTATRHVSWLALLTAKNGHASAGLSTLEGIADGEGSAGVRTVRARILMESGSDPEAALREAEAVTGELVASATKAELGWAQLIRSQVLLERGEFAEAESAIAEARVNRPPGDAEFLFSVIAQLLRVQDLAAATEEVAGLTDSVRESERGRLLRAEVALLGGNLEETRAALEDAGESAQAHYLRGRLSEARGEFQAADRSYETAALNAALQARAQARRANLARMDSRLEEAMSLVRPVWERGEIEEETVVTWFLLQLDRGDLTAAREALRRGRAEVGDRYSLSVQQVRLDLAEGRAADALALSNQLVSSRENDADLHILRYRAAQKEDDRSASRESFQAASRLAQSSPSLLIDLALAAQESGDQNAVEITLQAAERAGASGTQLHSIRGRMNALAGRGVVAVREIQAIPREARTALDWDTLTRAAMQAGDERLARSAAGENSESFEAQIALAEIAINGSGLSRGMSAVRALSERTGLTPKERGRALSVLALGSFQLGDMTAARRALAQAEEADSSGSALHLVRAELAEQAGQDVTPHLRLAVQAPTPLPDAVGWLALEVRSGPEACRLAASYLESAPRGYDSREVRALRCP